MVFPLLIVGAASFLSGYFLPLPMGAYPALGIALSESLGAALGAFLQRTIWYNQPSLEWKSVVLPIAITTLLVTFVAGLFLGTLGMAGVALVGAFGAMWKMNEMSGDLINLSMM